MSEPEIQEEGLNSNEGSEETAYQVKRDSSSPDFQWTKPIVPENKNNKKQSFTMIEEAFVSTKEGNFEKVKELLDKGSISFLFSFLFFFLFSFSFFINDNIYPSKLCFLFFLYSRNNYNTNFFFFFKDSTLLRKMLREKPFYILHQS